MKMTDINSAAFLKSRAYMSQDFPYKLCRLARSKTLDKPWYCEYYMWDCAIQDLKRCRVLLKGDTEKEREVHFKIQERRYNKLLKNGYVRNKPVDEMLASNVFDGSSVLMAAANYFLNYHQKIVKKKTYESYKTDIKRLQLYLEYYDIQHIRIGAFDISKMNGFLDWLTIYKKLTNRSRNNTRGTMATMFNWYINREVIEYNPAAKIKQLPTTNKKHVAFSIEQAKLLMSMVKEAEEFQLHLYLSCIYYCMLRPGAELRYLKVGDIKERAIYIRPETAKNRQGEFVPMPDALKSIIEHYGIKNYNIEHYVFTEHKMPGVDAVGRDYFYNKYQKILKQAGLHGQGFDIYSWKHTGVIQLWMATQDVDLIRNQCRHRDVATTMKYLRFLGLFTNYEAINKMESL
jgi:integrase